VIEVDPKYVDVAVRRWQQFTAKEAEASGDSFDARSDLRMSMS